MDYFFLRVSVFFSTSFQWTCVSLNLVRLRHTMMTLHRHTLQKIMIIRDLSSPSSLCIVVGSFLLDNLYAKTVLTAIDL